MLSPYLLGVGLSFVIICGTAIWPVHYLVLYKNMNIPSFPWIPIILDIIVILIIIRLLCLCCGHNDNENIFKIYQDNDITNNQEDNVNHNNHKLNSNNSSLNSLYDLEPIYQPPDVYSYDF